MRLILTLCIGNICRSPIAQGLLAQQLPKHTLWSAGLSALVGQPADSLSVQVAAAHGVDISAHRAQQVNSFLCQQSELILVMEQSHKTQLEAHFPSVRGKTFRLGQYGQFDIADPYRQPLEAFESAYTAIAQGVADWVPRIQKLG
ncbi:MAG: low molecular weight phosphotyrosine protein phosphatase [Rhodoferax sp.]|nr:low molecular weight phosphotyrosine protein phosphatase [Betaproteobacteria bacterium]NCN97870.1 low molecular weight phosphotyrosine protein phosphatase [Rhodoferax sp.]OIP18543.1 MAG: protein tyrosine phosphatase [Comamonadaceae bacterium CG2_30_57_122]PIZ23976.1 MAG: protein tyrosine phosphatase [Comamonadaceae bacterium CG_4_10_14_0_8_um_filter_57_29]PJC17854.1 MAG: protein tyrosine phosphatase [Comamonadaceae bacterium CG_4_9_14_0_8_um_filter_57_21]